MKAIFASKMYKASHNKEKIRAGLENPVNAELVEQLREYLDDEYLTEEYFGKVDNDSESAAPKPESDNDNISEKGHSSPPSSSHSAPPPSGGPSLSEDLDDMMTEDDDQPLDDESDPEEVPEEVPEDVEDEDVTESGSTDGIYVKGSERDLTSLPESIKGTLNARQDTAGVNRALLRDDELWIYYNDRINLNNVMGNVIELLNASSYKYLDFNRLARSENAIVFQVNESDTGNAVDPVTGEVNE